MSERQGGVFTLADHRVRAVSIGGLETCIELPDWRMCFDIGRCPESAVRCDTVLFTHAHIDHLGGIVHHVATRDLWSMSRPRYIVPSEYVADFEAMLAVWRRLDRSELRCEVVGASPGDRIPLGKGRRARVFRSVHRQPTLGYAIEGRRQKLKAEFVGLPGPQIGELRKSGVEIHDEEWVTEVAFCGDTLIDVLDREPWLYEARLLVLECTFLDADADRQKVLRSGHVHVQDLVDRAALFRNEALLLTHFSSRYSGDWIRERLSAALPDELSRLTHALLPPAGEGSGEVVAVTRPA